MLEIEGAAERTGLYYTLDQHLPGADEVAYIVANSRAGCCSAQPPSGRSPQAAAAQCPRLERMLMTGPGARPRAGNPTRPPWCRIPRRPGP